MPIPLGTLAMCEEALRHDQVEIVLCARHCDVEQPAFLRARPMCQLPGPTACRHRSRSKRKPTSTLALSPSGSSTKSNNPHPTTARPPDRWSRRRPSELRHRLISSSLRKGAWRPSGV
jgi:hypothetical protein